MASAQTPGRRTRRWIVVALAAALAVVGGAVIALAQGASTTSKQVGAFPMPGTPSASPQTQISLRGAPADELGTVEVTGSRTGAHGGRLREHSDGQGASFVLDEPLAGDERVTVKTELSIPGATDGDYGFQTVARPKRGLQSGAPPDPKLLRALVGQRGRPPKGVAITYNSRPDLRPPEIEINKAAKDVADGYILISPKKVFGGKPRKGLQAGPMIIDDTGEPVWFARNDNGNVTDFRLQQYQGKPVLTWWQGRQVLGTGEGVVQIVDTSYRPVATVQGGNGYKLDFHDTLITPQNTLIGIVYNPVTWDLSSVGGSKRARVVDSVIQEIDIATGLVMFEWHSLGTIALNEGKGEVPKDREALYDYVHANSATVTPKGNILVGGRETWAAYELERNTGRLLARIGGTKSDYRMRGTSQYAFQHDVYMLEDGTLRLFDNEAAPKVRDQSRGLILKLEPKGKAATVTKTFTHKPDPLTAGTQGNMQALDGGHFFVGWGTQGYFSEFTADGEMLFDARIERGEDTYRAYRFTFTGTPKARPAVAAEDGGRTVYASFNGATQLVSWDVLAGDSPDALKRVASAKKSGFETRIRLTSAAKYVAVQAKDTSGKTIGTSKPIQPGT